MHWKEELWAAASVCAAIFEQQLKKWIDIEKSYQQLEKAGLNDSTEALIQFSSIQFYLYSAKLQQMSSQGT